MKLIKLRCDKCGKRFDRSEGEYRRSQKLGRPSYCTLSCSTSMGNQKTSRGTTAHLDSGNRRDEFTGFRYFLRRAKYRKKRGITDLTLHDIKEVWDNQKGICPFTGWKLELPHNSDGWKDNTYDKWNLKQASIDRLDHHKSYSKDNIRFVSIIANIARNSFSDEDLHTFCEAVHKKRVAGNPQP